MVSINPIMCDSTRPYPKEDTLGDRIMIGRMEIIHRQISSCKEHAQYTESSSSMTTNISRWKQRLLKCHRHNEDDIDSPSSDISRRRAILRSKHHSNKKSTLINEDHSNISIKIPAILILFCFVKLLSSSSISTPTKEPSLARLGRMTTANDDDELARTLDRSSPGHEEDDPISAMEIARSRELISAEESLNRYKISERFDDNSTYNQSSGNIVVSSNNISTNEPLGADSQLVNLSVERGPQDGFISVLNNQSSTVHLDEVSKPGNASEDTGSSGKSEKQTLPPTSINELTGNSIELLHNVVMNEPSDMIQSQAMALLNVNETSKHENNHQLNQLHPQNGAHDKREERRRKTAGSDPMKPNRADMRGSIKSVITRPKEISDSSHSTSAPKFGVPTKLLQQSKLNLAEPKNKLNNDLINNNSSEDFQRSIEGQNLNISNQFIGLISSGEPNNTKNTPPNEMRFLESATVETTASTNNNNNNNEDSTSEDYESMGSNEVVNNNVNNEVRGQNQLITTTEAPSEDSETNSPQAAGIVINKQTFNDDDKSLVKPIKVGANLNNKQQQLMKTIKTTHHELLVGPFKSESDAPDTITLAGVVYQKSGSSPTLPLKLNPQAIQQVPASSNRPEATILAPGSLKSSAQASSDLKEALRLVNNNNNNMIEQENAKQLRAQLANLQGSSLLASNSMQHNRIQQANKKHPAQGQNQWTPQSLPSATQLFLPISQAQLISLLGQPGKLMASASQTIAQAAAAKTKDKSKYSITFTSIPTGESILSSLASTLDLKLANPTASTTDQGGKHSTAGAASSISSQLATGASNDVPDWASSTTKSSPTATSNEPTPEQIYLSSLLQGATGGSNQFDTMATAASNAYTKDHKGQPVVIVEKNVKPMKYHLLRAYLKLRRLLRPGEATYVFPVGGLKRGQHQASSSLGLT